MSKVALLLLLPPPALLWLDDAAAAAAADTTDAESADAGGRRECAPEDAAAPPPPAELAELAVSAARKPLWLVESFLGLRAPVRPPCTARCASMGQDERDEPPSAPFRCAVAGETRLSWRFSGAMFGEACMRNEGDSWAGEGGCLFGILRPPLRRRQQGAMGGGEGQGAEAWRAEHGARLGHARGAKRAAAQEKRPRPCCHGEQRTWGFGQAASCTSRGQLRRD